MHLSREFFELIKAIGESKSKQEEDRIIAREVVTLKKKLETGGAGGGGGLSMIPGSPVPGNAGNQNGLNTNKKKAREFLVRVLYVEMVRHLLVQSLLAYLFVALTCLILCYSSLAWARWQLWLHQGGGESRMGPF